MHRNAKAAAAKAISARSQPGGAVVCARERPGPGLPVRHAQASPFGPPTRLVMQSILAASAGRPPWSGTHSAVGLGLLTGSPGTSFRLALQGAAGEDAGQVLAVGAVGVDVLGRVGTLRGQRGRVRDAGPPGEGLLGRCRPDRYRAHVGQRDPAVGRRDPDDRPVVGPPDELLVPPVRARSARHPDRGEQLIGLQLVSKSPAKKSSARTVRGPPGPEISTEPPSATSAIGRSAAGSACASEPPIVPRCRICGSPTCAAA